jgi:K+-transporting ATPase ATPase C chain
MIRILKTSVLMLAVMTLLTGIVYPLAMTAVSQAVFPWRASGSLIASGRGVAGSELVGQPFDGPRYFHGRPSATSSFPCNPALSSGSNLDASNPLQTDLVKARIEALRALDPGNADPVPVDLVTASGSGLDPEISPAGAAWQAGRVARSRGIDESVVRELIALNTKPRTFGVLGEPRVNVLKLNLDLDRESAAAGEPGGSTGR